MKKSRCVSAVAKEEIGYTKLLCKKVMVRRIKYALLIKSIGIALVAFWSMGASPQIESTFTNPVFEPILADPTVIRDSASGYFYAYGTEDNWGDGKGNRLMPIVRSKDLIDWEYVGTVFKEKPHWKNKGGLWAPDINKVGDKYHLYYSYSLWGDADPGIGLAVADRAEGPFVDKGKLFTSHEVGVPNSIDPSYYEEDNNKYLIWGSFGQGSSQGIHAIPLSKDATTIPDLSNKFQLAAGDWEAAMIHRRDGYYYFFGSKGSCCEGANSKYHVLVARSKSLRGPYLDKSGRDIRTRGAGTVILRGDETMVGPGHHSKILTDNNGVDWVLYHAIRKQNAKVSTGASRRVLMLDKVSWKEGWPIIADGEPSQAKQIAPVFN